MVTDVRRVATFIEKQGLERGIRKPSKVLQIFHISIWVMVIGYIHMLKKIIKLYEKQVIKNLCRSIQDSATL